MGKIACRGGSIRRWIVRDFAHAVEIEGPTAWAKARDATHHLDATAGAFAHPTSPRASE